MARKRTDDWESEEDEPPKTKTRTPAKGKGKATGRKTRPEPDDEDDIEPIDAKADRAEFNVEIDEADLLAECVRHSAMVSYYGFKLADARKANETANHALKLVKAEMDRAVRAEPEDYGLVKVTESTVEAAILETEEYKNALQRTIDAGHDVGVYAAAMEALAHRKRMLTDAVSLVQMRLYDEPNVRSGDEEAVDDLRKKRAYTRGVKQRD